MSIPTRPPVAERRPVTSTHHGRTRVDEYDWLRAKEDPAVVGHLDAENAWTEARTTHLAPLRQRLFDEIKARTLETDLSVPTRIRDYWYYGRSFEGRQYGASCRVPAVEAGSPDAWRPPQPAEDARPDQPALPGEEVLLDLDAMAEGHEFFSLGGSSISLDDRLLAYATDVVGDERYTVRVKDLATGELLADELTGVLGGVTWGATPDHFYYSTVDDAWRADKVWRHRLGSAQDQDELVFHEPDERFWVGVGRTRSQRYVMVATGSKTTTEYHVLDAGDPAAEPWCFAPRESDVEYSLEHAVIGGRDTFLVLHNASGPEFELATAPPRPSLRGDWMPLLSHDPEVRLEDVAAFANHLVIEQRTSGQTEVRVLDLGPDGVADDWLVGFPGELHTVGVGGNPGFDQPVVRVGMASLVQPSTVYDVDVSSRGLTLLKQAPVLGGYDPDDYEEHRLWAPSTGGVDVPISLVVRKDARDGGAPVPLLLYGYGAYETSIDPYFSVSRLSLLDRGAAFAIAHVRGGGELGRRWYDDGKLASKQHTFDDFVACARHLVAAGWTTADRLVAEGGSAGGLLMGAVANQAPDAFGGIVASVPFVDNLTTMLDPSLPLTVTEYDEWGDPAADAATYDRIAAYAPYDNVADLDYPPILAETSLNDTRVLYVEPAKWVARLRATAPEADVLLRTEMSAGHVGVSGRYRAWHDRAFTLAWILDRMGLADVGTGVPDPGAP